MAAIAWGSAAMLAAATFAYAGCTTGTRGQSPVDGAALDTGAPSTETCAGPVIRASDYDQSCTVDSGCVFIAEGNLCDPCDFQFGVINVGALARYKSDIANSIGDAGCPVSDFVNSSAFCCCNTCQADSCEVGLACVNPFQTTDAATDAAADASVE